MLGDHRESPGTTADAQRYPVPARRVQLVRVVVREVTRTSRSCFAASAPWLILRDVRRIAQEPNPFARRRRTSAVTPTGASCARPEREPGITKEIVMNTRKMLPRLGALAATVALMSACSGGMSDDSSPAADEQPAAGQEEGA